MKNMLDEYSNRNNTYIHELIAAGIAVSIFLLIAAVFYLPQSTPEEQPVTSTTDIKQVASTSDPFANISLDARAAYVWDTQRQVPIYSKNPYTQLPLASITKLMTTLVAHESLDNTTTVTVELNDLAAAGDNGLLRHERWNLQDIIDFTLVESSNDGARAIASAVTAIKRQPATSSETVTATDLMNRKAEELGLSQTLFMNPSGLDLSEDQLSGGYGSARDVAMLVDYLLRNEPDLIDATTQKTIKVISKSNITHTATNTNKIITDIPLVRASKTGFTDQAGGNLVLGFNLGPANSYIITVLGSTREGRFTDMRKLYNATRAYTYFRNQSQNIK